MEKAEEEEVIIYESMPLTKLKHLEIQFNAK